MKLVGQSQKVQLMEVILSSCAQRTISTPPPPTHTHTGQYLPQKKNKYIYLVPRDRLDSTGSHKVFHLNRTVPVLVDEGLISVAGLSGVWATSPSSPSAAQLYLFSDLYTNFFFFSLPYQTKPTLEIRAEDEILPVESLK